MDDIKKLWAAVWHVKGSFHIMQIGELLEVNRKHCIDGKGSGYIPLALGGTMEEAQEKKREVMREKFRQNLQNEQNKEAGDGQNKNRMGG